MTQGTVLQTIADKSGFGNALTDWYHYSHRDLPWRKTTNPYHIWLSEIMLQQTQVNTVLPYYERFLSQFPTIETLAKAPVEQLMKAWEGLGYYARCRNLQKAAQVIMEKHNGEFPDTLEAVEALPGIGRSTAGAILTFSFAKPHPLLDGNVKRVLSRIYAIQDDVTATPVIQKMWEHSQTLLNTADDPVHYNQAIMELGATLCTPKNPQCLLCPVRPYCDAAVQGIQQELPRKAAAKATPHHTIAVGVIFNEKGEVFIQRRPPEGLLGGLWEFPGGKQEANETLEETVQREIQEELNIKISVGNKIIAVNHAYTHFKITLHAFCCQYLEGEPQPTAADAWQWLPVDKLSEYAFPKANKRVLEKLLADAAKIKAFVESPPL